ncbi:MAG: FtsX-like permease family protein [Kofleriaceae bacterium]|nr:FtsX-like permease family protein [Kofleriaceae bacterium]
MRAIDRKLVRDLLRMRGQVITIALVLAAGVAATVTLTGTYRALGAARDDYYAQQGFPDLFVHLERAPDAVAQQLAELPGVATVTTRVATPLAAWMPGLARPATGVAISLPADGAIRGLVLRRGRPPDPARADEVVVLASFAEAHALTPGDRIEVVLAGRRHRLTVTGMVMSPEYVFPVAAGGVVSDRGVLILWMPRPTLAARTGHQGSFNDATFVLAEGASARATQAGIDRVLATWGGLGAHGRDQQLSHRFVSQELDGLEVMATRVPIVFLLVAAFLLNVVLGRLIQLQREQLAVLRALGYRRAALARHVGAFAAVIVVLGGLVGLVGGTVLGGMMTRLYVRFFHFPDLAFHLEADLAALAVVVCAGATVAGALVAMRRTLRLAPAEAMRAPAPARYRPGLLSWLGLTRVAGPLGRVITRELERKPIATLLSVVGVGFALAIVIIGRFSRDSIDVMVDDFMVRGNREDVMVVLARAAPIGELSWFRAAPGVMAAEPVRSVPARLLGPGGHRDLVLTGVRRGDRLHQLLDARGAVVALPTDGVLLSRILASRLGVGVGDVVAVERRDGDRRRLRLPVGGVIDDSFGMNATLDADVLARALGEQPLMSQVLLVVDPNQRDTLVRVLAAAPMVADVIEMAAMRDAFLAQTGASMDFFIWLVVVLGVVIAVGVVYNNARVALSERARDLATLRVLGYRRSEVAIVLLGQMAVQVALAVPVGMAAGYVLAGALMSTADPEQYRFPVVISAQTYGFATLVVGAAALVTAILVRRRLDRLDLNDALKARD